MTSECVNLAFLNYYGTGREVPDLYRKLMLTGDDHIAFNYKDLSRTPEGEWVNSICPRGMSGGPIIDLGAQAPSLDRSATQQFDGRLAGIFLEHHEDANVLLGVKINLLTAKIREGVGEGAAIAPDRDV